MFHLMQELGAMGEGSSVVQRRPHTPMSTVIAAAAYYQHHFTNPDLEGAVGATFNVRSSR